MKQMFNHYRNIEGFERIEDLIEKDEGIKHEYKSSFNLPYPELPNPEIIDGKKVFKLGNKSFNSEKEVIKFIQKQFKIYNSFLNIWKL